ncbi:MAG: ATP-binding protein [Cyclobacteriaceae bacterium]|nr:ATP-binding protein [Cyclobacteriaceae bacterium]
MRHSEEIEVDKSKIKTLQSLVAKGEGEQLEFKRKATHPEKIVRELIAFANSKGGTLMVGVSDDGSIPGIKFPDEELYTINRAIIKKCIPRIRYKKEVICISPNRYVISLNVETDNRKPYYFRQNKWRKLCFIRKDDKSLKASKEVQRIIGLQKELKDAQFTFGEHEKKLFQFLHMHEYITLSGFIKLCDINYSQASTTLIQLVLANVLQIEPCEKEDRYHTRSYRG